MRTYLILLLSLFLVGCDSVGGELRPNGTITPCGGDHTDPQACGNATFNSRVIGQIHSGATMDEVRAIMKHDAERRTIDGNRESWGYITDYQAELITWVVFTDGKVSGMTQGPWKSDR
jgi:hypothetical protein